MVEINYLDYTDQYKVIIDSTILSYYLDYTDLSYW